MRLGLRRWPLAALLLLLCCVESAQPLRFGGLASSGVWGANGRARARRRRFKEHEWERHLLPALGPAAAAGRNASSATRLAQR